MELEKVIQLEPILGAKYKYESIHLRETGETLEEAYQKIEEDLKLFIKLEKQTNPVKTGDSPF